MAAAGLLSTLGDYLWIAAVSMAPASTLMPFQYAMFAWACLLDLALFGAVPQVG